MPLKRRRNRRNDCFALRALRVLLSSSVDKRPRDSALIAPPPLRPFTFAAPLSPSLSLSLSLFLSFSLRYSRSAAVSPRVFFGRESRHISNVILARTMRLPRVKCLCRRQVSPPLHHTMPVPVGAQATAMRYPDIHPCAPLCTCARTDTRVSSSPRLAANYTLMRRRVIQRRRGSRLHGRHGGEDRGGETDRSEATVGVGIPRGSTLSSVAAYGSQLTQFHLTQRFDQRYRSPTRWRDAILREGFSPIARRSLYTQFSQIERYRGTRNGAERDNASPKDRSAARTLFRAFFDTD